MYVEPQNGEVMKYEWLRSLSENASPPPWGVWKGTKRFAVECRLGRVVSMASDRMRNDLTGARVDARFIAVSRQAVPALLDVVEALDRAFPFNEGLPAEVVAALERLSKIDRGVG